MGATYAQHYAGRRSGCGRLPMPPGAGRQYLRVNPLLPREIGLGSIKYIPELLENSGLKWIYRYHCLDQEIFLLRKAAGYE